jgi:hypothetical protein
MFNSVVFFTFSISVLQLLNGFGLNGEVVSEINDAINIAPGERLAADKVCQLTAHVACWVEEAITVDVLYGYSDISHFSSLLIEPGETISTTLSPCRMSP